jgi:GrpB-like predicted nucleotidyltransferase (UPF0157 family)
MFGMPLIPDELPRAHRVAIVSYDPTWPTQFENTARELREVLGDRALRIDHIGSTSVPGLAAKPVIDVQVSVATLAHADSWTADLMLAGFRWDEDNEDLTKRFFHGPEMGPSLHVHVRELGSLGEQLSLVFRDYLRSHRSAAQRYEAFKRDLSTRLWRDGDEYAEAKTDIVWPLLNEAFRWSAASGWRPRPSDA